MENIKYISLEKDKNKLNNLNNSIESYKRNLDNQYSGRQNRIHLRRSEKRLKRLLVVIDKKSNGETLTRQEKLVQIVLLTNQKLGTNYTLDEMNWNKLCKIFNKEDPNYNFVTMFAIGFEWKEGKEIDFLKDKEEKYINIILHYLTINV